MVFWLTFIILLITGSTGAGAIDAPAAALSCDKLGWFPEEFGLKDHTVFRYDGYYYLAAIYVPGEYKFAYGRSLDLCDWEELTPILPERTTGDWDEMSKWAPFVYEEAGTYYLYYSGVTSDFTQSIMLATSTDPADPSSWQRQGVIFQPSHNGTTWQAGAWADCRDPTVIKIEDQYYLYYSGYDLDGGITGLATAISPTGPWIDWGTIIPALSGSVPESPTIYYHQGFFYLFYHPSNETEYYRFGGSPAGPWSAPTRFAPGWAHEIWPGQDGTLYTSFLTDYTVTISPLTWNTYYKPAQPFIGAEVHRNLLPLVNR